MKIQVSTDMGLIPHESMSELAWANTVPWNYSNVCTGKPELICRAVVCMGQIGFVYEELSSPKDWRSAPFEVYEYGINRIISRRKDEPDPSSMQFTGPIDMPYDPKLFIALPESSEERNIALPESSEDRKKVPLASIFDFFPLAMVELAKCIYVGNEKHNQGNPIQWQREKSDDHSDCLLRHFMERGYTDTDGIQHSAKVAWRALAILQLELERCTDKKP